MQITNLKDFWMGWERNPKELDGTNKLNRDVSAFCDMEHLSINNILEIGPGKNPCYPHLIRAGQNPATITVLDAISYSIPPAQNLEQIIADFNRLEKCTREKIRSKTPDAIIHSFILNYINIHTYYEFIQAITCSGSRVFINDEPGRGFSYAFNSNGLTKTGWAEFQTGMERIGFKTEKSTFDPRRELQRSYEDSTRAVFLKR